MPTRTFYRHWCSNCNDWEWFYKGFDKDSSSCKNCGTPFQPYSLDIIPDEKIIEQRKRYTEQNKLDFNKIFEMLDPHASERKFLTDMFSPPGYDDTYIEHDAGQKEIDLKRQQERAAERARLREERDALIAEYQPFKNLTRNDTCACGSGKKYKKCCMHKYELLNLK